MKSAGTIVFLGLLLVNAFSCSGQPPISGTIQLDRTEWRPTVYLIAPTNWKDVGSSYVGSLLDSAQLDADGYFSFQELPEAEEAVLWQLAVQRQGERFLNRLDNDELSEASYMPVIWQNGDRLQISAEAEHFQETFAIEQPGPDNMALLALRDLRFSAFAQHLGNQAEQDGHSDDLLAAEEALLAYQEDLMRFAGECPHLLPALTAIRWASIEGNYERFPELIVAQAEHWQARAPNHPWVQQLASVGDRKKMPVLIGDHLPDYPMPLLAGDTIGLSSLLGERLTLLDLWASWCGPCRVQNKEYLVPMWEKHQAEGFQIIGYGLEASDRAWRRAIEMDGVQNWPHASDLMGDDSPLFEQLRISTIPANYLLDADGKVIAKNLHGEELADFVQAYLSE